jgi:3-mercaptopyruvate sulfurtransferase SseA
VGARCADAHLGVDARGKQEQLELEVARSATDQEVEQLMARKIGLGQLKRLLDAGAQLVEVLPPEEYAEEHLPSAINIPLKQLNADSAGRLNRTKPVVVYCHDGL